MGVYPSICAKAFGAAQTAQLPNTTGLTIKLFHHIFAIVIPHTLFSSRFCPITYRLLGVTIVIIIIIRTIIVIVNPGSDFS